YFPSSRSTEDIGIHLYQSHFKMIKLLFLVATALTIAVSAEENYRNDNFDRMGHDIMMRGGAKAERYAYLRDFATFQDGGCIDADTFSVCSTQFAKAGFKCDQSRYNFVKGCQKYCEFCV
uniref:Uncharacterized protein n=1 Tax=Clytia hemisphaerica TaxID=252671 RepID=A0A7M5WWP6_9CNID